MGNALAFGTEEVRLVTIGDQDVTIVTAIVGDYSGVGSARRNPDDKTDHAVGTLLATGRAVKNLGRELEKAGHQASAKNQPKPSPPKKKWSARQIAKARAEARGKK